jgi:hypothetical protein
MVNKPRLMNVRVFRVTDVGTKAHSTLVNTKQPRTCAKHNELKQKRTESHNTIVHVSPSHTRKWHLEQRLLLSGGIAQLETSSNCAVGKTFENASTLLASEGQETRAHTPPPTERTSASPPPRRPLWHPRRDERMSRTRARRARKTLTSLHGHEKNTHDPSVLDCGTGSGSTASGRCECGRPWQELVQPAAPCDVASLEPTRGRE